MIVGVVSDSHGNRLLARRAADLLATEFHATRVVHLGDDWDDRELFEMAGFEVYAVPGLWCPEYRSPRIPRARLDTFDTLRVAFAHAEHDLPPAAAGADLLLCGHTHRPEIARRRDIPFMNPGHLKGHVDRGHVASFGIIDIDSNAFTLSVHALDGLTLMEERFPQAGADKDPQPI